ncbi:porin family protein [Draconibacterium halophilum]|uniref:PorT family protein n=1 Tax=Draconibacterium halophilum TaxID=2706887 RepID=A0A6C0RCB2_9BACT|nr:porin family protein [Draconibacterium halophilum]QIA07970.1 PorT family protein [Draconibacterium halophilum]
MKRTASLFIIALFVLTSVKVMAQYPSVTFFGGANMATTDWKFGNEDTDVEDSYKALYGMNIGALYEYVLNKDKSQEIAVEGGLIFENKGFNRKSTDNKTTMYFIDVPLYVKYLHRFRSRNKLYVGAGPFVGMGLFGNADLSNDSESLKFGNDPIDHDYKRLDYGVTGKVGFLFLNGFNMCVSYDYGFADIKPNEIQEAKTKVLRLSLGYTIRLDD